MARAVTLPRPGGMGKKRWMASSSSGDQLWWATKWISLPSNVKTSAVQRLAQRARAGRDGVEDWLDIRRRATDHPQDLTGRRLLLQRLGQLAVPRLQLLEQPDVLDGDDRLGGEGLEERDLLVGERSPLEAPDGD